MPSTTLRDRDGEYVDASGVRSYGVPETRVAVAAISAKSAALIKGVYLVHASVRCFIRCDSSDPTATNSGIPLEIGEKFHLQIPVAGYKIAVIRDTADGFLNIVPCS